ncbi:tyrosine-type recombinase/integrase [Planococcus shixiaomingii]|uniref:tyrosine-type recombinase/integrase n=1 Tax=Planococcus shixiaomingii TaxID=3058393 RepID=UPI0026237A3E|nr:tyrosine-type recombinase/integrase [Planococcus sp. N022]WKA53443.1 tyrosine-type recombinase/integrase [Planococcus sp. N022]
MELEDVFKEYYYYCEAKGFTQKTMINKKQELKQVKEYLMHKRAITELESVTSYDLKAYVRMKQIAGLQPQSIVSMFKIVHAFFSWCEKEEYLTVNIASKVETPNVPKKILKGFTGKEVHSMVEAFTYKTYLEARNKAIIAMLADTGIRAMEIRGLQSLGVKETTILVNGKGNKERMVFISPALKRILIKYERMKKQYFNGKDVNVNYFLSYTGSGLSHVALDSIIKEAGKRAGITGKRVSPHTFRHFYAVTCLNEGKMDVYSLSRLLGHSDITVTQRYLQSMNDEQLLSKAITSSPLMNIKK